MTALTVNSPDANFTIEKSSTYRSPCWHSRCLIYMREESHVLISIVDTRTQRRLILEGKIIAPWTAELRATCERARAGLGGRELIIHVRYLTAVSQEGENVLLELMNEGIKFRGSGVFSRHLLAQLARRRRKNGREKK